MIKILRQLQRVLIIGHGGFKQLHLRIGIAQIEVIGGQLGLKVQLHCSQICRARLSALTGRFNTAPNTAPGINLIREFSLHQKIRVRQTLQACGSGGRLSDVCSRAADGPTDTVGNRPERL